MPVGGVLQSPGRQTTGWKWQDANFICEKRHLKSEKKKARTIRGKTNGKGWNCILSSESLFLLKASFINWELSWEITKYEKRMKNCRKLALLVTPGTTNIAWRDKCFANHSAAKMLPHEPQTETNVQCRGPWKSRLRWIEPWTINYN